MPYNPFTNSWDEEPSGRNDEVMTPGVDSAVRTLQGGARRDQRAADADPLKAAMSTLTAQKTQLGYAKQAAEQLRDKFLSSEGSDLFHRDPLTAKLLQNPDKTYMPKLGAEIEGLRKKAAERVGTLRGALTPAVAGDFTPEALDAQRRLAEQEPIYKAKLDKWERIQEQLNRITAAHDENEMHLGQLSAASLERAGVLDLSTPAPTTAQPPLASPTPTPATPAASATPPPVAQPQPGGAPAAQPITPGQPALQTLPAAEPGAAATAPAPVQDPGRVTGLQIIQLHRQMKEAERVMAMETSGPKLKEASKQKIERIRERIAQGMTLLPSDLYRKRVIDATRDPSLWEYSKNVGGRAAEGVGSGLVDLGEFVLRNALKFSDAATLGVNSETYATAQAKLKEFSEAMREEAASWGLDGVPREVAEKLADTWGSKIAQGVGSTVSFMIPATGALRLGKIMGATPKMLTGISTAAAITGGAAQEGNSMRREAEASFAQMVANGEMTEEEARKGANMAELVGALVVGPTEGLSPVGKWSKSLAGVPAGQTFLRKLAKEASNGGTKAVTQWLRGNGRRFLVDVLSETGEEAAQEFVQSTLENITAREVGYDKDRAIGEGTFESGGVGGITGALISSILGIKSNMALTDRQKAIAAAMQRGAQKPGTPPPPAAPPAGQTPPPATPAPVAPVAPAAAPVAESEGDDGTNGPKPEQWTFKNAAGEEQSVEGTGLRDAIDKLPEGFEPDLKQAPTRTPIEAKPAAEAPAAQAETPAPAAPAAQAPTAREPLPEGFKPFEQPANEALDNPPREKGTGYETEEGRKARREAGVKYADSLEHGEYLVEDAEGHRVIMRKSFNDYGYPVWHSTDEDGGVGSIYRRENAHSVFDEGRIVGFNPSLETRLPKVLQPHKEILAKMSPQNLHALGDFAEKMTAKKNVSKRGQLASMPFAENLSPSEKQALINAINESAADVAKGAYNFQSQRRDTENVEFFTKENSQGYVPAGHYETLKSVETKPGNASLLHQVGEDSAGAIGHFENLLEQSGWKSTRKGKGKFWTKGNRELFIRSQGPGASPIVQWKISQSGGQSPGQNQGAGAPGESNPQEESQPAGKTSSDEKEQTLPTETGQAPEVGGAKPASAKTGAGEGAGKNTPAATLAKVTKASGIKAGDRAHKFLSNFLGRLGKANPKAFAGMKVEVLSQAEWDAHPELGRRTPDSAGAYSGNANTLFINSDKNKGEAIVSTIVHEAGHFAEQYALGVPFTKLQWAQLDHDQRLAAWKEYSGRDWKGSYAELLASDSARTEWVAFQFARVVRGETEGMNKGLKARLERFLADVRELVNRWVGDGKLTTAELDAKILDMLGYQAARETITPADDTLVGKNAAGEELRERKDGSRYRMRNDRKDRPNGYPDFGGDLAPVPAALPAPVEDQEPEAPANADQAAQTESSSGGPASGTQKPNTPKDEGKIQGSARTISAQRKLLAALKKRAGKVAGTAQAKHIQKRINDEQETLAQLIETKRDGVAPQVGFAPNGEPDLISDISEHVGRLQTQRKAGQEGAGELDGALETLKDGAARLLRGGENGTAWDEAVEIINEETGRNFQSVGDFQQAIRNAVAQRTRLAKQVEADLYKQGVEAAALSNEGRTPAQTPKEGLPVEQIGVGGTFRIKNEKFSVIGTDEGAGGVTMFIIKDGHTFTVPEGTMFYPDRKSLKKAKPEKAKGPVSLDEDPFFGVEAPAAPTPAAPAPEAKPKKFKISDKLRAGLDDLAGTPSTGELFGNDETPFNLAGQDAKDFTGITDQQAASVEAKAKNEAAQAKLFTPEYNRKFGTKITKANAVIEMLVTELPDIRSRESLAEFIAEQAPALKPFSESLFQILSQAVDTNAAGGVGSWPALYTRFESQSGQETSTGKPQAQSNNEPRRNEDLERNRRDAAPRDGGGKNGVRTETASDGKARRAVGERAGEQSGSRPATGDAAVAGAESDSLLPERKPGTLDAHGSVAGGELAAGSGGVGPSGVLAESFADSNLEDTSRERGGEPDVAESGDRSLASRVRSQKLAEPIEVVDSDLENIKSTLPVLLPAQHDDVLKAELRFINNRKLGMMFTNGTGTGKTFTGLGVIKRWMKRVKERENRQANILILVPSSKKAVDWRNDGMHLNQPITLVEDTSRAPAGVSVTTYANFRQNEAIMRRDYDMVVYDESHRIMENQDGEETAGFDNHRFLTSHPDAVVEKAAVRTIGKRPVNPGEDATDEAKLAYDVKAMQWRDQFEKNEEKIRALAEKLKGNTKVLFLSATPFAYRENLRYADGYLFDIPKRDPNRTLAYNEPAGWEKFMVDNFGYRMRYNKLTKPEAGVDVDLMEREFSDRLEKEGAMSGRAIDVPQDYSREFVLLNSELGLKIDEGIEVLMGWRDNEQNKYNYLRQVASKRFKYHMVQSLLEAIKVSQSIDRMRQHIALGRKIILFHSFVNSQPSHPFRGLGAEIEELAETRDFNAREAFKELAAFEAKYPHLVELDMGRVANPLELMKEEFGPAVVFFNGNVSDKRRMDNVNAFNTDDSPVKIIMGQSQSMKEGVSLHDTTGKHPRVVSNVSLPIRPTDAIQEEGRAYRVGVMSDAINEYMVLHTNSEVSAFGSKVNERTRTAENLAMGSKARALEDAFKNGYLNPNTEAPSLEQGKGGKAADRRAQQISDYERAKTYYFSRMKKTSRNKAAEGIDYYPTPEPVGMKMVSFLFAKPDERLLEPSAGHGAIGRFFPKNTQNVLIEPSIELANEARIKLEKGRVDTDTFENHHVSNKYEGIAMNPPFGVGGKTAMEHLEKAFSHLKDGGRVVALIPEGPAADKRYAEMLDAHPEMHTVAEFGLPTVTFERAGTSVKSRIVVLDKADLWRTVKTEANGFRVVRSNGEPVPYSTSYSEETAKNIARNHQDFIGFVGDTIVPSQSRQNIEADEIAELFDSFENLSVPPRFSPPKKVANPNPLAGGRGAVLPVAPKPGQPAKPAAAPAEKRGAFTVHNFPHTKTGELQYVAKATKSYDSNEYTRVNALVRKHSGRYSSYKGGGAVAGFLFTKDENRQAFLNEYAEKFSDLHGTPGVFDVDPAAPNSQQWEAVPDEQLDATDAQRLRAFEANLNRERRAAGQNPVRLTAQAARQYAVPGREGSAVDVSAPSFRRASRALSEAFGKRVIFYKSDSPMGVVGMTSAASANTILVNAEAEQPLHVIVGHELAHNMDAQRPDLFDQLATAVEQFAPMPADYSKTKLNQGYAPEVIRTEWVGDVLGERMDEPQFWDELARYSGQVGGKAKQVGAMRQMALFMDSWFKRMGARLKKLFSDTHQVVKDMEALQSRVAEILAEYTGQGPYDDNPGGLPPGGTDADLATTSDLAGTPPVRGTPQQEEILKKVTGTLEDKRSLAQRVTDTIDRIGDWVQREAKQLIVDRFAAIKRYERKVFGTSDLDAAISPYKFARLTSNLAGVMEYLLKHGQIQYSNGSIVAKPGTVGLTDILQPIVKAGKLRLWEGYVAAFRANNLLAEGKEKNFGKQWDPATNTWAWDHQRAQDEINELLDLGAQHPEFETARQQYVEFQNSVLDLAESAGLIDPAKRALWQRSDYVPFYRIVEALDGTDTRGPKKKGGLANQSANIRKLKGAPEQVAILENIFRNLEHLVDASFKNIAAQRIADMAETDSELMVKIPYKRVPFKATYDETVEALEKSGVDVSTLTRPEIEELVLFWRARAPKGKDILSVMHNGKPVYYRVKDAPLLRSILAMGPQKYELWMRMLMAPKRALTKLVTLDPAFMAANTIRDSLSAWVIADSSIKPGWDSMRGFAKALKNDPVKLGIMAAGGGTGHYNTVGDAEVRKQFLDMVRKEGNTILDTPAKVWRLYKELGRASENANRIAIAESALKNGASPAEAAFQALDIMDFGLRGDSKLLSFFLDTVPFMNARLQGLYRLGRGYGLGQGDGINKLLPNRRFATHGAVILGATLALLAANWDDERYWDLPEWERDLYYHFWIGDRHVRIPKPFEVGQIFSTLPERLMQFAAKDGNQRILMRRLLSMIGDTFAMNPTPQIAKPLLERATNTSFLTWNSIISQGDQFKSPEEQFNAFTSLTARELAQAAPDNAPAWLRSPKTIDFLIRGYLGTLGMYGLEATDAMTRAAGNYPERPALKPGDYWLMRRFSPESDLKDSKYVSEFYELNQDISELTHTMRTLAERGEALEANKVAVENSDLIGYGPVAGATEKMLNAIRRQENDLYENPGNLTPEQRREELERLKRQKNELTKRTVKGSPRQSAPIFNPFR